MFIILIHTLYNLVISPSNLIIGDSQVMSIHSNINSNVSIDENLYKVGCGINELILHVKSHPINNKVERVFICVGTNDGYKTTDGISTICLILNYKFPKAKLFVIVGSYGWGFNKDVVYEDVDKYYKTFETYGAIRLKNEIGYCATHPTNTTPTIMNIGYEIDCIVNGR